MTSTRTLAAGRRADRNRRLAASWAVTVPLMNGMDVDVTTTLGFFGSFHTVWVAMVAAMVFEVRELALVVISEQPVPHYGITRDIAASRR